LLPPVPRRFLFVGQIDRRTQWATFLRRLAGANLMMQDCSPADSGDRFEGRAGQSWAEKTLKNGRILVGFQKLRKPQDTKGPYFPRNSPSTLPEWGSGGRWFESSRPDVVRPVGTTSSGWPISHLEDSFRPQGQSCGQRFDRSVPPDT